MTARRDSLELVRDYDAPPERVFAAWTDVATLGRWFGCADDQRWRIHAWEVRPGGRIHVSLDFDGKPYVVEGEFLVVERPRRLHYRWQDDQKVEVEIEARGKGSRLRLRHEYPAGGLGPILTAGWTSSLGALGRAVQGDRRMRSVVAAIVAFVVMAAVTFGLSIAPWALLGLDRALEPARFDGKLAYDLYAVAAAALGGYVGGRLCRKIGGSSRAVQVLALVALFAATGNAIAQRSKPEPGPRGAGVSISDAMVARREKLWFVVAIAALGPAAALFGGRRRDGGANAVEYATEVAIAAAPERVWRVLTDAAGYARWNPEIVALAGTLGAGGRIRARVRLGDGALRNVPMRVTEFVAPSRMQWTGGMPLGLFVGVRTFTVAQEGAGARFRMHLRMSGPLAPAILRSVGDRQPEIDAFSAALKREAERA